MKKVIMATGLLLAAATGFAAENQQLVLSQCLLQRVSAQYNVLEQNKRFALIDIEKKEIEKLVHESHSNPKCGKFFNVSYDFQKSTPKTILREFTEIPQMLSTEKYEISHQSQVKSLISESSPDNMWNQLKHLTSFKNRYADGDEGVKAIEWVKSEFDRMAKENNRTDVNSYFVQTTSPRYKQPSLVTVIGKDIKADAVVVGAHIDTYSGYKQGADDDGTGSATNLELARLLLSTKTQFKHPIYILWYSAEEWGLIGSQHVVRDFDAKKIPVKAVLQIDMSGYNSENNDVYVVRDNTDGGLDDFVVDLVKSYTGSKTHDMYCGYACSDHASWHKHHYKSVMPFEADLYSGSSPYIHSSRDTLDTVSLEHMTVFLKLAIGFIGELAEAQ